MKTTLLCALALALTLALGLPAPATASFQLRSPAGNAPYPHQRFADQARMPSPDTTITTHVMDDVSADCPSGSAACAWPGEMWFRSDWFGSNRTTVLHELGHQFEYQVSDGVRQGFLTIMEETRPFRAFPDSPHEQFATAWAQCALYGRRPPLSERQGKRWSWGYSYRPTARQHQRVCLLMQREAKRNGWQRGTMDPNTPRSSSWR